MTIPTFTTFLVTTHPSAIFSEVSALRLSRPERARAYTLDLRSSATRADTLNSLVAASRAGRCD